MSQDVPDGETVLHWVWWPKLHPCGNGRPPRPERSKLHLRGGRLPFTVCGQPVLTPGPGPYRPRRAGDVCRRCRCYAEQHGGPAVPPGEDTLPPAAAGAV